MVTGADIVNSAEKYSGVKYFEGNPQDRAHGLDCSGLVQLAMRDLGVSIPRTTSQQLASPSPGVNIGTDINQAMQGDILHYVGHEEIWIGWDNGKPMVFSEAVPGTVAAVRAKTPWPIIGIIRYGSAPGARIGGYGAIVPGGPMANPNSPGQTGGDPGEVSGQLVDIIPGATDVVSAIKMIWGIISGLIKFINDLTNPGFWKRVALAFLGLVLLVVGLIAMTRKAKVITVTADMVKKGLPVAN